MTTPASKKPKTTFDIRLQRHDLSVEKVAVTVHRLPRIIAWDGNYYQQLGETFYEQVTGEDLSNIRAADSDRILHSQQQVSA